MKDYLRGKHYDNLAQLASAISQWVKRTPKDFFTAGIEKLPDRWQKCVTVKGEYIEKVDAT